jgi:RNA polymerase sigma factor (sigma-70 family)
VAGDTKKSVRQTAADVEKVVKEYGPRLHRFLMRRFRIEDDVKDMMQEVFLRYLRVNPETLVKNPDAYLFGITFRVMTEFREAHPEEVSVDPDTLDAARELLGSTADDPLNEALRQELWRNVDRLPRTKRAVLRLRLIEDLSDEEIASRLGIAEDTVKKYLYQAKAWLRMNWHG